ncbi:MAG: GTPase Era [Rhodospirillaceae bacterium]|nr:GTPase Era [Rhodospirillaceae bacterium]MBT5245384.1 GTPase Era [Rhodospirillaceae bacterium]MBT5562540.1 GTPase Era [Rhodospirillaceae bacterium]MBT6242887.1 GTPase Era [Rhodospirillaceae bacterium]
MTGSSKTRCGFFALIGAPNVGKSTLVNRLVGAKVSIVSPKVQTTRTRVLGIAIKDQAQVIFIDTPGIFAPKRRLDRAMVASAWGGVSDADGVLLLVDAQRGINADTQVILDGLKKQNRQVMLGINKVDLVKKPVLLDLAATLSATGLFTEIFMISAETGDGVEDLMNYLSASAGESPWMYPEDQISDMPSRLLAAEITREKVFLQLHQELPYAVTVETEKWEQRDDGSARVDQVIFVERPGQKAIVLGKKGSRIKKIGEASRKELENLLGHRVHLFLFVKVREKWGDDPERYHEWGLDFNAK